MNLIFYILEVLKMLNYKILINNFTIKSLQLVVFYLIFFRLKREHWKSKRTPCWIDFWFLVCVKNSYYVLLTPVEKVLKKIDSKCGDIFKIICI